MDSQNTPSVPSLIKIVASLSLIGSSREGDYVNVLIEKFTSATLIGKIIWKWIYRLLKIDLELLETQSH